MQPFQHILAPVDFSEAGADAVELAVDLAMTFGARLTLLHVCDLPFYAYAADVPLPLDEIEAAAKTSIDAEVARIKKRWGPTEGALALGVVWEQIVAAARERQADLVVMGTHGRRGLPRLLLGSVAEKVVQLSPAPVLTIQPRAKATTVTSESRQEIAVPGGAS